MEKKSILIYSGIVVLGVGLMAGMVMFLRSRNAPAQEDLTLVQPTAKPAAVQNLPPPKQNVGVREFQPLDQVPQAKTGGTNVLQQP